MKGIYYNVNSGPEFSGPEFIRILPENSENGGFGGGSSHGDGDGLGFPAEGAGAENGGIGLFQL